MSQIFKKKNEQHTEGRFGVLSLSIRCFRQMDSHCNVKMNNQRYFGYQGHDLILMPYCQLVKLQLQFAFRTDRIESVN